MYVIRAGSGVVCLLDSKESHVMNITYQVPGTEHTWYVIYIVGMCQPESPERPENCVDRPWTAERHCNIWHAYHMSCWSWHKHTGRGTPQYIVLLLFGASWRGSYLSMPTKILNIWSIIDPTGEPRVPGTSLASTKSKSCHRELQLKPDIGLGAININFISMHSNRQDMYYIGLVMLRRQKYF